MKLPNSALIILFIVGVCIHVTCARTRNEEKKSKMIVGIAAGCGFVVGLVVLIITMWCCCCSKLSDKRRIVPADFVERPVSSGARRASVESDAR